MELMFGDSKITQFILNFNGALNIARSIAFWVIIAYILAVTITFLCVKDKQKRALATKIFIFIAIALVIGIITTFLVLYAKEATEYALSPLLYVPLVVFCGCLIVCAVVIVIKPIKPVKITCACLLIAVLIAVIVCLSIYYESGASLEMNWIAASDVNTLGLWLGAAFILVLIILTAIFTDKNKGLNFDTKSITYAGILGGLSLALSYVRIMKMPMGGSITLASVLPLMLYAYIFGTKKGVILGAVMGLLQAVQDPWILHPAQFMLDYLLAFASFGLAGAFAKLPIQKHCVKFLIGGIVAGLLRFLCHFLAGAWAFGSFAPDTYANIYIYSFVYQATYVLPDTAISAALGFLLMLSKSFTRVMLNTMNIKKPSKKG